MEYIYLKETDQNLKELKELTKLIENNKIPSPLIVAEQYISKFPDYAIRAEQLKQELIAFIYTFRPPIYIVEKYIEVVEAIKKFIGKNAVRTLPPLYDERFDADGTDITWRLVEGRTLRLFSTWLSWQGLNSAVT